MKLVFGLLCAAGLTVGLAGCGGSKETTSTVSDAKADAIAEYQAAMEAEQDAMNSAPPTDTGGPAPKK